MQGERSVLVCSIKSHKYMHGDGERHATLNKKGSDEVKTKKLLKRNNENKRNENNKMVNVYFIRFQKVDWIM
ncbi:unnamed protein product [Victoria cruziana]